MLISESAIKKNVGMPMLEDMQFIDLNMNPAALIPVVESTSRETKLISLEDVMGFAESQNIDDLGQALTQICETNQIDPNTVTFTVNEESMLDEETGIATIVEGMMANGINVLAKPVMDPIIDSLAEDVISYCVQNDDTALFEQFCGLEEVTHTNMTMSQTVNQGAGIREPAKPLSGNARTMKEKRFERAFDKDVTHNDAAESTKDKIKYKIERMIEDAKRNGAAFIRRQVVRLHRMVTNFNMKAQKENAPIWRKLASVATRAIEVLTRYLKSKV